MAMSDERAIIREIRMLREEMDICDGLLDRAKWAEWRKAHGYDGPVSKMDGPELTDLLDDLSISLAEMISYVYPPDAAQEAINRLKLQTAVPQLSAGARRWLTDSSVSEGEGTDD